MSNEAIKPIRPLMFVFIILTALFIAGDSFLKKYNVDQDVIIGGNVLLFLVSLVSFLITSRSFRSANPNVFMRALYSSFIIKFFVVAIAAFIYIQYAGKAVNKPAIMLCAALYIIYTGIETRNLVRILKSTKNAKAGSTH